MNLFKSKHRKLLDEKEKIQELFDKVKAIKPISDIDIKVKSAQVQTLINNWVTLARLLDQYQPNFDENTFATYLNMVGGKRRVTVLRNPALDTMNVYKPKPFSDEDLGSPVLETFLPWEKTLPNLNIKAQEAVARLVERKKVQQVKEYCKNFKTNEEIFEKFILEGDTDSVNNRLHFVHNMFYTLHLAEKRIGNKVNILIVMPDTINSVDIIMLCNTLNTAVYDFLLQD